MTTAAVTLAELQQLWVRPDAGKPAAGRVPPGPPDRTGDAAAGPPREQAEAKGLAGTSTTPRRTTAESLAVLRARLPTRTGPGTSTGAARCPSHIDRRDWLDTPATNRPGWTRTTCKHCGAFIGYRPAGK
jgi:hypothetical protein